MFQDEPGRLKAAAEYLTGGAADASLGGQRPTQSPATGLASATR